MDVFEVTVGDEALTVLRLPAPDPALLAMLTEAERSVLSLVLMGRNNAEIAAARATSVRTVANQLAAIFDKLGVHGRSELAAALIPRGDDG